MKKFFLLCILFFYCFIITSAQSGHLDPSFGNKGIVKADLGVPYGYNSIGRQVLTRPDGSINIVFNYPSFISKRFADGSIDSSYGSNGYSRSVPFNNAFAAFQPDGKLVIAGSDATGLYGVARIKIDGTADSAFGTNGIQITSFVPRSVAIQSDGKIIIAGGGDDGFIVARYNTFGDPDNTFNGNGQTLTDFSFKIPPDREGDDSIEIHSGTANTVAIQADGKIVVGGTAAYATSDYTAFALARYKTNGTLDSTFDSDGKQTTKIGSSEIGYSLAIQGNQKILLAGYTFNGSVYRFAVARYNTNGGLDNSFHGNGKQTINVTSDNQVENAVAIQSDGKIVIAGYTLTASNNHDFAIARLTTAGNPDNTFDGDGILTTDFNNTDDYAGSVAIQSDGKILVAGYSYTYSPDVVQRLAVARYNSNGSLDITFDNDGKLEGDYKQGYTRFNSMAIQSDGKVVAAGQTWDGSKYNFAVARYNFDGSPDSTFNNTGQQITDFGAAGEPVWTGIKPDGKIIVAGNVVIDNLHSQFAMAIYNPDGTPDNTFNGNGKMIFTLGFSDVCQSAALQSDGKIIMAGFTYTDPNFDSAFFSVIRLNADGTFDNTFSDDGQQLTDFGTAKDFATSVAIHDGKIIVSGRSYINDKDNFSVARYNADGTLDNTFSQDGKQSNVFGPDDYFGESLAVQNDGKIIVGGYTQTGFPTTNSLALVRYKTNGDLDSTFGTDGFQTAKLRIGNSIAITDDGKIAVGGSYGNYAIALFKNDGNLDSTFGNDGVVVTPVGTNNSSIQSIAFDGSRLYAAGFGQFPGMLGVIARYILAEGSPLPVSRIDFKAHSRDKSIVLQWQIITQKNLVKFDIERSADGNNFLFINVVPAKGAADILSSYSIVDEEPLRGINFYRLKMFDADGKFTYSNTVAVKINTEIKLRIFPNPAVKILFVQANGNNENAIAEIVDAAGRKLKMVQVLLNGQTSFSVNIDNLSPGMYNLVLHKKEDTEVQTFIKR